MADRRLQDPVFERVEIGYRDEGNSLVAVDRTQPLPIEAVGYANPQPHRFKNITSQATFAGVKVGKGVLHAIVINKATASGTLTMYDNATTATAADKIGTITFPGTLLANQGFLLYDVEFTAGLTIVTGGADCDFTVVYR